MGKLTTRKSTAPKNKIIEVEVIVLAPNQLRKPGSDPRLGIGKFQIPQSNIREEIQSGDSIVIEGLKCVVDEATLAFDRLVVSTRLPIENTDEAIRQMIAQGFKFDQAPCRQFGIAW